jgi:hypothetical protein
LALGRSVTQLAFRQTGDGLPFHDSAFFKALGRMFPTT